MASKRAKRRAFERREREMYERKCAGKLKFASRYEATLSAAALARKRGDYVEPYACPFCSMDGLTTWHIGHPKVFGRAGLK